MHIAAMLVLLHGPEVGEHGIQEDTARSRSQFEQRLERRRRKVES